MLLAVAVIGSGIMVQRLTSDGAVALLANTLATAAALADEVTASNEDDGVAPGPGDHDLLAVVDHGVEGLGVAVEQCEHRRHHGQLRALRPRL